MIYEEILLDQKMRWCAEHGYKNFEDCIDYLSRVNLILDNIVNIFYYFFIYFCVILCIFWLASFILKTKVGKKILIKLIKKKKWKVTKKKS